MEFESLGAFLRWAHKKDYSIAGIRLTSSYNSVPYSDEIENDAKMFARAEGDEKQWPIYYEQIVLNDLRKSEGYDDSLEISV